MMGHVYREGKTGKKVTFLFGKLYDIDENGKAVYREDINVLKFALLTHLGSLTLGKKGYLKLYEFVNVDKDN